MSCLSLAKEELSHGGGFWDKIQSLEKKGLMGGGKKIQIFDK